MKKLLLTSGLVIALIAQAQTPALDRAKEEEALAKAQAAAYEAQLKAAEAKAKAELYAATASSALAKAVAEQQKAAFDAQAAAAEAKAKADNSASKIEIDLAKAAAEQLKASSDAQVAAQSVDALVALKAAETLGKQGEAYAKLFPVFDASKLRAATPTAPDLKAQQLLRSAEDAICLGKIVGTRIARDLGACSNVVIDAAYQRTAIRTYNTAEAHIRNAKRRLETSINLAKETDDSKRKAALAALPAVAALIQAGGSLASLVSGVKSVYAGGTATNSGFDDALKSSVYGSIAAGKTQVYDPRMTMPRIGIPLDPVTKLPAKRTGLIAVVDEVLDLEKDAQQQLEEKKTDLGKLEASQPTAAAAKRTWNQKKADLAAVIKALESAIKNSVDLTAFLLKEESKFNNQAPIALIAEVDEFQSAFGASACTATLELTSALHQVDTRVQDSTLQLHQRVYVSSAGLINWRVWNTRTGALLSAGTESVSQGWLRKDERSDEVAQKRSCS